MFSPPLQHALWRRKTLPTVIQTEAAECALACLAMVAGYWEHRIDIAALRRRFSISIKGTSLKSLIAMADALDLQARPLKVELEHLGALRLPCILHWGLNHFVVLKEISRSHAVIHDPALGRRRLRLAELSREFTGVALELTPTAAFRPGDERQRFSLPSLMGRITGLKRGLAELLLLGLALQVCMIVAPFYLQWLVDEALVGSDRDMVTVLGCGFLLLVLLQTTIHAARSWATTALAASLNIQWLGNVFAHLMRLPLAFFEKRHAGDIVSRFASIQTIQRSLTTEFVEGIIDGVMVLGTLAMMWLYSSLLAGVACAAVLLYTGLRLATFGSLRDATTDQIIHAARQQTHFLESVRGVQSIRLFGKAGQRRTGWMNTVVQQVNAELRIARFQLTHHSASMLIFNGERVIIIWLAALAVLDSRFSLGMLFAFLSYKEQFSQRVTGLVDKYFEWRMLALHGERLADIVMTPAEAAHPPCVAADELAIPSIELRDVSFRYADGEPWVLHKLSLTIPPGQSVALTGPSGCGKTTLVKVLLGLLEPSAGQILIGGEKLSQIGPQAFRRMTGSVMQNDCLFAGTIGENICFFDDAPDQARIQHCALLASIHQEILGMPMGYNTIVGDIGTGLSGGQQQRVLLARALYKAPSILVFDEATSSLDQHNESVVNAAIRQIPMTRVLVAHRAETIATAQRVLTMDQGRIASDVLQANEALAA